MIRAYGKSNNDDPLMVIGLSAKNLERLKDGKPIRYNTSDWGADFSMEIVLLGGEDEDSIIEDMRSLGWLTTEQAALAAELKEGS